MTRALQDLAFSEYLLEVVFIELNPSYCLLTCVFVAAVNVYWGYGRY